MYARDKNGVLLFNGDPVNDIIIDEMLLIKMFRWLRSDSGVKLGVKSPWWAKFVESEWPENFNLEMATAVEIDIYWTLNKSVLMLSRYDQQLILTRCGTGKRLNYRKCGAERNVSHEQFRQQLQSVISRLKKTFDKVSEITV